MAWMILEHCVLKLQFWYRSYSVQTINFKALMFSSITIDILSVAVCSISSVAALILSVLSCARFQAWLHFASISTHPHFWIPWKVEQKTVWITDYFDHFELEFSNRKQSSMYSLVALITTGFLGPRWTTVAVIPYKLAISSKSHAHRGREMRGRSIQCMLDRRKNLVPFWNLSTNIQVTSL